MKILIIILLVIFAIIILTIAIGFGIFMYHWSKILDETAKVVQEKNRNYLKELTPKNNWEEQRGAMFDAWKKKEDEKQANCEHQWSYAEPIHCVKCALSKSKIEKT